MSEEVSEEIDENGTSRKDRSLIEFPYYDLESAIKVVKTIYDNAGQSCTPDQLSAYLQMAPNSGGFRARLAPTRTFGLANIERGRISLTDLGLRIVDPSQEAAARVDAFLTVPLYKALFDRFRSRLLPPVTGLEAEISALGVAPKQSDKARQAFERSASQAGFFALGKDRLVQPIMQRLAPQRNEEQTPQHTDKKQEKPNSGMHPFIEGLLKTLPEPGSDWALRDRAKWLQAAGNIFDLIYKADEHEL